MQSGEPEGQSVGSRQSTQPSVALHCWPILHWSVPFTPQSALPPPGPPPVPPTPLQAIAPTMTAHETAQLRLCARIVIRIAVSHDSGTPWVARS